MRFRPSLLEIFLLETCVWLGLWLLDHYVAALLTLIVGAIVSAVLVIALIAEGLERSRVPRRYFSIMAVSILAPLVAFAIYVNIFGGELVIFPED